MVFLAEGWELLQVGMCHACKSCTAPIQKCACHEPFRNLKEIPFDNDIRPHPRFNPDMTAKLPDLGTSKYG